MAEEALVLLEHFEVGYAPNSDAQKLILISFVVSRRQDQSMMSCLEEC